MRYKNMLNITEKPNNKESLSTKEKPRITGLLVDLLVRYYSVAK